MSKDIFVIVEQRNGAVQKVSYELIGEATSSPPTSVSRSLPSCLATRSQTRRRR